MLRKLESYVSLRYHLEELGSKVSLRGSFLVRRVILLSSYFPQIYLIREYLRHYPELQVPSALVIRWAQINSLDSELHVLIHDFVVMFIMVMIMVSPAKFVYQIR